MLGKDRLSDVLLMVNRKNLNEKGVLKNQKLANAIPGRGFYKFRGQLEYKSKIHQNMLLIADMFCASSKKTLKVRQTKRGLIFKR